MSTQNKRVYNSLVATLKKMLQYAMAASLACRFTALYGASDAKEKEQIQTISEWIPKRSTTTEEEKNKVFEWVKDPKNHRNFLKHLRFKIIENTPRDFNYKRKNLLTGYVGGTLFWAFSSCPELFDKIDIEGSNFDINLISITLLYAFLSSISDRERSDFIKKLLDKFPNIIDTLLQKFTYKDREYYGRYTIPKSNQHTTAQFFPFAKVVSELAKVNNSIEGLNRLSIFDTTDFASHQENRYLASFLDFTHIIKENLPQEGLDSAIKQSILEKALHQVKYIENNKNTGNIIELYTHGDIIYDFVLTYLQVYPEETSKWVKAFQSKKEGYKHQYKYLFKQIGDMLASGLIDAKKAGFDQETIESMDQSLLNYQIALQKESQITAKEDVLKLKSYIYSLNKEFFLQAGNNYLYRSYLAATRPEVGKIFYPTWFFTREFVMPWTKLDLLIFGYIRSNYSETKSLNPFFSIIREHLISVDTRNHINNDILIKKKALQYIKNSSEEDKAQITKLLYDEWKFKSLFRAKTYHYLNMDKLDIYETARVIALTHKEPKQTFKALEKIGLKKNELLTIDPFSLLLKLLEVKELKEQEVIDAFKKHTNIIDMIKSCYTCTQNSSIEQQREEPFLTFVKQYLIKDTEIIKKLNRYLMHTLIDTFRSIQKVHKNQDMKAIEVIKEGTLIVYAPRFPSFLDWCNQNNLIIKETTPNMYIPIPLFWCLAPEKKPSFSIKKIIDEWEKSVTQEQEEVGDYIKVLWQDFIMELDLDEIKQAITKEFLHDPRKGETRIQKLLLSPEDFLNRWTNRSPQNWHNDEIMDDFFKRKDKKLIPERDPFLNDKNYPIIKCIDHDSEYEKYLKRQNTVSNASRTCSSHPMFLGSGLAFAVILFILLFKVVIFKQREKRRKKGLQGDPL